MLALMFRTAIVLVLFAVLPAADAMALPFLQVGVRSNFNGDGSCTRNTLPFPSIAELSVSCGYELPLDNPGDLVVQHHGYALANWTHLEMLSSMEWDSAAGFSMSGGFANETWANG